MATASGWRFSHLGTGSDAVVSAEPDFAYLKPAQGGPLRRVPLHGLSHDERERLGELEGDQPLPEDLARALLERNKA